MQQMHAWRLMGVDDVSVAVLGVDISRMSHDLTAVGRPVLDDR